MQLATTAQAVQGAVLTALRHRSGIRQSDAAKRAKNHQASIARIEAGTITPTPELLASMLDLYGWADLDFTHAVEAASRRLRDDGIAIVDKHSQLNEFCPVGRSMLLHLVTGSASARVVVPVADDAKDAESEDYLENAEISAQVGSGADESSSAGADG